MKEYIVSLFAAALVAALIGVLSPEGEGGGISKHMRLLTALFLLCVIVAPIGGLIGTLEGVLDGTESLPGVEGDAEEGYREELENALSSAAKPYFANLLIEAVKKEFSIPDGEVRCAIRWRDGEGSATPERISIILSGSSIWRDPSEIEKFVRERVGCECVTAIE